jgi:hypothetical protein
LKGRKIPTTPYGGVVTGSYYRILMMDFSYFMVHSLFNVLGGEDESELPE